MNELRAVEFPMKPETFPDAATCLVRPYLGTDNFLECLSRCFMGCPHLFLFGGKRFCRHPDAAAGGIPQVADDHKVR